MKFIPTKENVSDLGTKNVTKEVSFCRNHGIRMCTVVRGLDATSTIGKIVSQASANDPISSWYCPDLSAICWKKAHKFYIPKCLWGKSAAGVMDRFGCPRSPVFAIASEPY